MGAQQTVTGCSVLMGRHLFYALVYKNTRHVCTKQTDASVMLKPCIQTLSQLQRLMQHLFICVAAYDQYSAYFNSPSIHWDFIFSNVLLNILS